MKFLALGETNPKENIMKTKYNKSRILRYFIIFFFHFENVSSTKRKIPYIYFIKLNI